MTKHREFLKRYLEEGPTPVIGVWDGPRTDYQRWLWDHAATVNETLGFEQTIRIYGFDDDCPDWQAEP